MPEENIQKNPSTEANPSSQDTPATGEAAAPEKSAPITDTTPPEKNKGGMSHIIIVVVVVALILGIAYFFFGMKDGTEPLGSTDSESNLGAVATVNGTEIKREDYDRSLGSLSQNAALQGANTADPAVRAELENQALTMVINNELLIQAAADAGFTATDEAIETQFQTVVDQFGGTEELSARLTELGITEDDLRADIEKQISVNDFVNAETNLDEVAVTDGEIDEFVATLNFDEADMPPMEQIRPQIEASLIAQKQQELIDTFISSLRDTAEIEELI